MLIKALLILTTASYAQVQSTSSRTDQRVNDHIQSTNKKIEIEGLKKEVELKKDAPKNLKAEPAPKKKAPFIVNPGKESQDPNVFKDQYDHNSGKDPSAEFEEDIIRDRTEPSAEAVNEEYIRQFRENAAKAGVKVKINPKTLKAVPVQESSGSN